MGSKPQPPAPPDPVAMSQAQSASNVNTATASARLNAVNQNSPYGTVTYDTIGEQNIGGNQVPQYQQNITLSPAEQQKLDQTNALTGQALSTAGMGLTNAQGTLSKPFDLSGAPALQTGVNTSNLPGLQSQVDMSNVPKLPGVNDFGANAKATQDAYLSRFNQDFPRQQEDVFSRLNAEGIQRGSEGYGLAEQGLERQQTDARNQAILAGSQEQSRLFGLASQANAQQFGQNQAQADLRNQVNQQQFGQNQAQAAFQNQAHQQGVSDIAAQRNQPINEFATLLGLGGQVQAPNGAPNFGINVGNTNVLGAYDLQQQGLQNIYNQKMGANNAMWGALGNMAGAAGSAAIMASDVRVKNIVRRAGRTSRGIPLWLYKYKGSERQLVGVLAQEVEVLIPGAVLEIGGIKHVRYDMVT